MRVTDLDVPVAAIFMAQALVFGYFSPRRIARLVADGKVDKKIGTQAAAKARRTGWIVFGMSVAILAFHFYRTRR